MHKTSRFLYIIGVATLIVSCTSFPEPSEKAGTLTLGKIVQSGKNYSVYGSASVNGINTDGIVITIVNISTSVKYKLTSQYGGFFSSLAIPPGNYEMKSFYLKVQSGNSYADAIFNPGGHKKFTIVDGIVNNLGLIEWNCDAEEGMTYWLDKGYKEVSSYFSERYPKSGWNSREWRDIPIVK